MWESFSGWLKTYESVAIWLEGIALVAIFILDWKQRTDQRKDREEQHRETLAQLNSSQAQADALINSERAWVMADVEWDTGKWSDGKAHVLEGSGTGGDTTGIYVVLTCRNEGRSPAWIEEKRARLQIVDVLPDKPDLTSAEFVQAELEPIGVGRANQIAWQATATGHGEGLTLLRIQTRSTSNFVSASRILIRTLSSLNLASLKSRQRLATNL